MKKILVSACLLGKRVRYDGRALTVTEHILKEWIRSGRVVSICPEVDAGMPIPRPAAEISGGDGYAVLAHQGRVITSTGADVTDYFRRGAEQALALCKEHHIKIAVLSEASPSCGTLPLIGMHDAIEWFARRDFKVGSFGIGNRDECHLCVVRWNV